MKTMVLCALSCLLASAATAAGYPVGGYWTYVNASASGPAKDCTSPRMDFQGVRRLDNGGGAPEYRNVSVTQVDPTLFRVVDEFFTVQIRGRVYYTIKLVDDDHIVLHFDTGGKTIALRRCASA